jgi:hypothetical protein
VFLYLVKPFLCLLAILLVPEPLYVKVRYYSEVVLGRVPYFVVEE